MKITVGAEHDLRPRKEWRPYKEDYRIVWGWSRPERYWTPARWLERWHLEWFSPFTSDWERISTFEEGITKEFLAPCRDWITDLINQHARTRARTYAEIRAGIEAEMLAEKLKGQKAQDDVLHGYRAPFPGTSWIPASGPATDKSRRKAVWEE